ncbi:hypothetical protein ROZALSC1DRAFT_27680 [Rozella allomycis CSF55]|uniref:ARM repeat-containing protein n=1 Tax=Rozella allomycis (strain CSF55) TaxID=988480 RepID=A0A4P9YME9_ROZAC|nr:hypothetical protein ROZALSC1DRAFT_27680 [Rozella allomycis CSF55]
MSLENVADSLKNESIRKEFQLHYPDLLSLLHTNLHQVAFDENELVNTLRQYFSDVSADILRILDLAMDKKLSSRLFKFIYGAIVNHTMDNEISLNGYVHGNVVEKILEACVTRVKNTEDGFILIQLIQYFVESSELAVKRIKCTDTMANLLRILVAHQNNDEILDEIHSIVMISLTGDLKVIDFSQNQILRILDTFDSNETLTSIHYVILTNTIRNAEIASFIYNNGKLQTSLLNAMKTTSSNTKLKYNALGLLRNISISEKRQVIKNPELMDCLIEFYDEIRERGIIDGLLGQILLLLVSLSSDLKCLVVLKERFVSQVRIAGILEHCSKEDQGVSKIAARLAIKLYPILDEKFQLSVVELCKELIKGECNQVIKEEAINILKGAEK